VIIILWLAFFLQIHADSPALRDGGEKALGVCEVLVPDPTRLNGRRLAVRGRLVGSDEGVWLTEECATHLVTKGLIWGNAIAISLNESDGNAMRSWQQLQKRLKRRNRSDRDADVWVTLIGRLSTRATMADAVVEMPYGLTKAGFGHLGASAAEIEVVSVRNVETEPRPKRPN
jgi:hypothetical protein